EDRVLRRNLDPFNARIGVFRTRSSGSDPIGKDFIFLGIYFKPFAAFVWNRRRGFEQNQTPSRIVHRNTSPQSLLRQHQVITIIVVATQRQLESVLTSSGPMASPRVATSLCQHRLHVIAEAYLFATRRSSECESQNQHNAESKSIEHKTLHVAVQNNYM